MHWAVILAGGSGTRFWPLSSPHRPKQTLPLAGPISPARDTAHRLTGLVPAERTLLVTGPRLAELLQAELALPRANVLVEPQARSTGPALAWASHEARRRDPDALVLSLHADWHVPDRDGFRAAAGRALEVATRGDHLVTVGVTPTRPETGYGYIIPGEEIAGDPAARRVARFTEKPDVATARTLIAQGALWNSGLFAWRAELALAELARHTPEVAGAMGRLDRGDVAGFFAGAREVSIDVGLLERSDRVVVVRGTFAWDDIGNWDALGRIRAADGSGNVLIGPVTALDSRDVIVWSEGTPVVAAGLTNLIVVHANDRLLILDRSRAGDLKGILERVPAEVRAL
jgi:mannose-1-phosphate guanylyltransferase